MKSFVIIGLGRFGTHIAELLCAEKKDVLQSKPERTKNSASAGSRGNVLRHLYNP